MPLPSHLPQQQPNSVTPSAYMLDGGVYQGQPPSRPLNERDSNTKVKLCSLKYLLEFF
jgi:hypothetical protein